METIRDLIQRLATLTADELAELRAAIVSEAERLDTDEASVEDIAVLQELAGFGEQVMAQEAERAETAAQAARDREEARNRISQLNPPAEETETTEETPEAEETETTEETPEATEQTPAPEAAPAEPVAASGNQITRMAARQGTPGRSPEAGTRTPPANRAVLTAAGALRGRLDPSAPIEDRMDLAAAMADTLTRMPRKGAPRGDVLLASASFDYPEERKLGSDAWENERKFDTVNALTATGGICLPVNVDYGVPTFATADRPIRDGLPGYQATRGGIRYVQPPDIGALAGATGIWTEATDLAPGSATKPIVSIACGTEILAYVEAVSTRLGFGNMQSRFAPEQVAANTDLAIAAAARVAENNLLNLIAALCVPDVTVASTLGATRDLLATIDRACAAYRNVHRIPRSQTMTAIFPDWVKDLLRIDLVKELAHDNSGPVSSLMLSDEDVVTLMKAHGVNPIFHLDGQPSSVAGGVAQVFAQQTGTGALLSFPTTCVWYLFGEGMIQFLDGGRLDLGVVRDSTLDATNDYETFIETFENVVLRGFANSALQMVSTLCANGTSSATLDVHTTCA